MQIRDADTGNFYTVWSGSDPTTQSGDFTISFPQTTDPVDQVRVTINNAGARRKEIDAVQLLGAAQSAPSKQVSYTTSALGFSATSDPSPTIP